MEKVKLKNKAFPVVNGQADRSFGSPEQPDIEPFYRGFN
jgi:hypothetical protein